MGFGQRFVEGEVLLPGGEDDVDGYGLQVAEKSDAVWILALAFRAPKPEQNTRLIGEVGDGVARMPRD
jgi:hypothetical protein